MLVYLYLYWDEETGSHKSSNLYATLEAIHSGLGTPIYESAKSVDPALLEGGVYAQRAAVEPGDPQAAGTDTPE